MMFRIGQKVTQIKAFKWPTCYGEATPQFGSVYTVRAILDAGARKRFLRFYEIKNQAQTYADGTFEMDFAAEWFRPLVDRPTDITVFEELLVVKTRELQQS
jgi:hypothetical protein